MSADPSPAVRSQWVPWKLVLTVATAYAVGSLFAFWVLNAPSAIAVLFPPAGVSVAALILSARRDWPWVLVTVFATRTRSSRWCQPCSSAGRCSPRST